MVINLWESGKIPPIISIVCALLKLTCGRALFDVMRHDFTVVIVHYSLSNGFEL